MQARLVGILMGMLALFLTQVATALAAPTGVASHTRVAISTAASTADFSATGRRTGFVILQEWERSKLAALRTTNPGVKVLMYKNLSFMATPEWGNANTGVTTVEADANPSWYLLNTTGERFSPWSYSWMKAADIGNPAYQQRWAENVLGKLESQGWDGVFVDDTNPTMRHHYSVGAVAKYPSDAAYGAATGSALATIGPRLRGAGKLVIPNFGDWRMYRSVVDGWLDHVSGGMEEQFTKWGDSSATGYLPKADWQLQLGAQKVTEAKGKYFIGIGHSTATDAAAARYGWATTLLGAAGRSSFALAADYTNQAWFPEYEYAIGEPVGPEVAEANGVHRRTFSAGLVLVNPTGSPVTVTFGGSYSGSGLTHATQATMPPSSGLVLTEDAASQAGPAPAGTTTTVTTTTTPTATTSPATAAPALTPTTSAPASTAPTPAPSEPAPTTTTTTTITAPAPVTRRGGKKVFGLRATTNVQVRRTGSSATWTKVARKRATCPKAARMCTVRVRVEVKRAGVLRAKGARRVFLAGGRLRTIAVRVRAV